MTAAAGNSLGRERLPRWVERHQLPALGPHGADVMNGQREMQAGAAAQSVRMPGVVTSGGHHARGAGSGSHPNHRPHVAQMSRVLQQHDVTRTGQDRVRIRLNRTPRHGDDLGARHDFRRAPRMSTTSNGILHVGGESLEQALHLIADPPSTLRGSRPRTGSRA